MKKLSPLQLELLKVYALNPSQEDMLEIKKMLANYFADKLSANVAKAIEDKNIKDEDLESWLNNQNLHSF
ncbi:MAG: hypothetical protein AAGG75_26725 [Bacteroidota bacterium]